MFPEITLGLQFIVGLGLLVALVFTIIGITIDKYYQEKIDAAEKKANAAEQNLTQATALHVQLTAKLEEEKEELQRLCEDVKAARDKETSVLDSQLQSAHEEICKQQSVFAENQDAINKGILLARMVKADIEGLATLTLRIGNNVTELLDDGRIAALQQLAEDAVEDRQVVEEEKG